VQIALPVGDFLGVSLAAMALFFVLIQRTKNQVKPKASLRTGPYPAKRVELGWKRLPYASPLITCASVKISYALQPHRPPLFYTFSAETVGLTKM
jgi:hypothetical protein